MNTSTTIVDVIRAVVSRKGIARRIADQVGERIETLAELSYEDLRVTGITESEYQKLSAALQLGYRVETSFRQFTEERLRISSPGAAKAFCLNRFADLAHRQKEEFWVVTLNAKNRPIQCHQITVGTLRNSLVHPREVFRVAIRDAANVFIAVHNHPSGDPTPSDQDISVTENLEQVAEVVGIPMLDHIIIGGREALSIQEWRSRR